jgi:glycosyltransferase involved in cell wall biosynthesis
LPFRARHGKETPVVARHILTLAQTLQGGGVERAQLRLAADWLAAGRRVTLAIGDAGGPLAAELPPGIELAVLGSPAYHRLYRLPGIEAARSADLIFCPGNHYTSVVAWTRLRLGRRCPPIVAKLSNALDRGDHGGIEAIGYRAWLRLHPRFVDRLVAMSPAMAAEALAEMRFPPERLSVIPNPPARHAADPSPPPLPEGRFLLGVGRLEPQKRWDRAIAALPTLADREARLVILGEGSDRPRLEALVGKLGLGARVSLPGHALDPRPAIERAAAVVLTSDYEGVPGVLREALALGTPVVTTESSVAVREIVASPALGCVVARDDAAALAAAFDRWLDPARPKPDPVPEPGEGAAETYLDLFDALVANRRKGSSDMLSSDRSLRSC